MPYDDENPEWTAERVARARRGADVLPPEVLAAFRQGRREMSAPKRPVSIRLDTDVVDYFKRAGAGWQTRINAALREAMDAGR